MYRNAFITKYVSFLSCMVGSCLVVERTGWYCWSVGFVFCCRILGGMVGFVITFDISYCGLDKMGETKEN